MPKAITAFACPPHCAAGGSEDDGGHVFDIDRDFLNCTECGHLWTVPAGVIFDLDCRKITCPACSANRSLCTGGSLFCRCGLSAMDWTLMRVE